MESYPTMSSHPDSLMKKITLLQHFRSYMNEHLQKAGATMTAGANTTPREGDELARLPYLKKWLRTSRAMVLHLSNGTIQINFFQVCRGLYLRWLGGVEVLSLSPGGGPSSPLPQPQAPAELFTHSLLPSKDHTKLILCPMMAAVTCINKNRDFHTYSLSLLEEYGCCEELGRQLCYAHTMVDRMLSSTSPSSRLEDNT
ncbi:serine/threonine-protein kinase PLK1-like isoform X1 [Peromyscus leucopus]|uniref:serine/threonine-protein kinase PLK1-like isoform X1 n=1 Tax=Peromyscus leucopus TaxID=10041 RepID=UPI0010A1C5C5|nr:serine/threonine-protein kinase PLK1-like isoform X1 [Peromyscus leucopus]